MALVAARLGLHPLAVEDAVKAHQIAKVEPYGQHLFVVAYTAQNDANAISYGETAIFVGRRFIVTARHGSPRSHSEVRETLEANPLLLRQGPDYVLHAILDHVADGFFPLLEQIEATALALEDRALDNFLGRDEVAGLFRWRRELLRFARRM